MTWTGPDRYATFTREIEEFGIVVNVRYVRDCKVKRLRHNTGQQVHEVVDAYIEWVTGAPKMKIRYSLRCGDIRKQTRAHLLPSNTKVTCPKCIHRRRKNES